MENYAHKKAATLIYNFYNSRDKVPTGQGVNHYFVKL